MANLDNALIHPGLNEHLAAGRVLIMVLTHEEERLHRLLTAQARQLNVPLATWTITSGLVIGEGKVEATRDPGQALAHLSALGEEVLVWFKDLGHHYQPAVVRGLRDLYYRWLGSGSVVIISGPSMDIPLDLEREMGLLTLDMPSVGELLTEVNAWSADLENRPEVETEVIAATLKGLTLTESWHALTRVKNLAPSGAKMLRLLQEEKRQLIQKSGTLEYIPDVPRIEDLGGLDYLKDWLVKRKKLLLDYDDASREIAPKGMLLMGVSGCGKSLCVKAVSSIWQLPLYRLEMVRIFSGAHGGPELAFANACRLMEEMSPAILWIDEIEMGLSGEGSSAADATLSRIFAFFLTWMQEKPPGLFVAATANRIDLLPAEMIRKGRFDQVFFVDLPTTSEREAIFQIHLEKRGFDPSQFNLEVFADGTRGWNGAEIEQCVIAAITNAKMEDRELELKDLYASRRQIVPISTTMEEQVRHIRNWAYDRAVRASPEAR